MIQQARFREQSKNWTSELRWEEYSCLLVFFFFFFKEYKGKELTEIYVFARCAHPSKSASLYKLASLQRVSFSPFTYEDVSAPGRSLIGVTMPRPKRKNCGKRFRSSNPLPGTCQEAA